MKLKMISEGNKSQSRAQKSVVTFFKRRGYMKNLAQKVRTDTRGASLVEYSVLVALITLSTAAGVKYTGATTDSEFWGLAACEMGGGSECTHGPNHIDIDKKPSSLPPVAV